MIGVTDDTGTREGCRQDLRTVSLAANQLAAEQGIALADIALRRRRGAHPDPTAQPVVEEIVVVAVCEQTGAGGIVRATDADAVGGQLAGRNVLHAAIGCGSTDVAFTDIAGVVAGMRRQHA